MPTPKRFCVALLFALVAMSIRLSAKEDHYIHDVKHWRRKWDDLMRSKKSPLTVIGKVGVNEGESSVGSDPASSVVLPPAAPAHLGTLLRNHDVFSFEASSNTSLCINGKPRHFGRNEPHSASLLVAASPAPSDHVGCGHVSFVVRPERDAYDIYVLNEENPKTFKGIDWFPIDLDYRMTGTFVPEADKKPVAFETSLGTKLSFPIAGEVVLKLNGETFRLQMVATSATRYMLAFWDKSSGKESYGGGRYVEGDLPKNGEQKVSVDFNTAYNPYCAYSQFSACILPPKQNRIPVPILAGAAYRAEQTASP